MICATELSDPWLHELARDSCNDIRDMSRRNNIWSWAVAYAIEAGIIALEKRGDSFGAVDVYHDPLTPREVPACEGGGESRSCVAGEAQLEWF